MIEHEAQQPVDAFGAVLALLTVIVDAKACQSRLLQLEQAEKAAKKAQAALATERAAFDAHVVKAKAEMAKQEAQARKREVAAADRERRLAADLAKVEEHRSKLRRPVGPGSLTREFDSDDAVSVYGN